MARLFHKHYNAPNQLVDLLKKRGLIIEDDALAQSKFHRIGYYRFSAYLYPFLAFPKENQQFKSGSSFTTASSLYSFDQQLRLMLFAEIAKVEVAIRSALANIVARETGNVFWMTDASMYADQDRYRRTIAIIDKELDNSREDFIAHFRYKYSNPYPPAWILVEILPMGVLNHIYSNLASNVLRKKVAAEFSLAVPVFGSWLTIMILTRNACCHHSRVWNKENAIPPVQPRKMSRPWLVSSVSTNRIFYDICILKYFTDIVDSDNKMMENLTNLLRDYPMVDTRAMGFPDSWRDEPLWGCR